MTSPNYGHYGPGVPPTQPNQPVVQPPKKKTGKTLAAIGAALGVIIVGCCIGGIALSSGDSDKSPGDKTITTTAPAVAAPATKATSKPAPLPTKGPAQPKPGDFKLTVKLLDKKCYGSAGCLVDYRISKVAYSGPALDPDGSYEITYKVTGLEDAKIGTFTLNGDGSYSVDETESGQTSSSSKVIKAAVTEVEAL